jgi:hypothetical protein
MASELIAPKGKPASTKPIDDCAANGCPLPGVIHTEAGSVCSVHYLAPKAGWPQATGVVVGRERLLYAARRAQQAGLPQGANKGDARRLIDLAISCGVEFGDEHREAYKASLLKFRMAGQLVERGITALAVAAAMAVAPTPDGPVDREAEAFTAMLRALGSPP